MSSGLTVPWAPNNSCTDTAPDQALRIDTGRRSIQLRTSLGSTSETTLMTRHYHRGESQIHICLLSREPGDEQGPFRDYCMYIDTCYTYG